jgi:hypothetical protein
MVVDSVFCQLSNGVGNLLVLWELEPVQMCGEYWVSVADILDRSAWEDGRWRGVVGGYKVDGEGLLVVLRRDRALFVLSLMVHCSVGRTMQFNNALCCHKETHKEPETEPAGITKNKILELNVRAGVGTKIDKSLRTECRQCVL